MVNKYIRSYSINDKKEASFFSDDTIFAIFTILHECDTPGLTSEGVYKQLRMKGYRFGKSKIYETLKNIFHFGIVRREYDDSIQARRYSLSCKARLTHLTIDPNFRDWLLSIQDQIRDMLFPSFSSIINQIINKALDEQTVYLPKSFQKQPCRFCNRNHEIEEFFYAILLFGIQSFLFEESSKIIEPYSQKNLLEQIDVLSNA